MSNNLIKEILNKKTNAKSEDQLFMENLYKELLQHSYLFALSQIDFFDHIAFHGGTCLRIVDKIDRFSEDLDFVLVNKQKTNADIADMLNQAKDILSQTGLILEITHSPINNNIQKIWIKEGTLAKQFLDKNPKYAFQNAKSQIKIEIDTDAPIGSTFVDVELDFPEKFKLQIQDHSSSFAGKLHAVLCRDFFHGSESYIKGRDYFDLDWYLSKKIQPNYELLKNALFKAGPFKDQNLNIDQKWLNGVLTTKLEKLDWELAKKDMTNFLLESSFEELSLTLNSKSMITKLNTYLG